MANRNFSPYQIKKLISSYKATWNNCLILLTISQFLENDVFPEYFTERFGKLLVLNLGLELKVSPDILVQE